LKRTTTNTYTEDGQLKKTVYSAGKPEQAEYEYNGDGDLTKIKEGTGASLKETIYGRDQLDRVTETQNRNGEKDSYKYDLDNEQTEIVYPNTKPVTRTFDNDSRLKTVTDWASHTTEFRYNPDSDLEATKFPTATGEEDTYTYDEADAMTNAKMAKGSETLANIAYTRDNDEQVKSQTQTSLPGEASTLSEYDPNNRLTKAGSTIYEYDAANNPTFQGTGSYSYDADSELETGPSVKYSYSEAGQRTKMTPTTGPATTYGYDQDGNLTSIERSKEGATPEIKDSYTYDANDLRTAQTIGTTTTHLDWNLTEPLPLLLSDETNSYIYGPAGLPIEQINNSTSAVTYLHHDQSGSTRLLTGATGTVTGKCSYAAYGTPTCEGSATTPLGFDGEYTSPDTGLIYMRARTYDPATEQFLSVDPLEKLTGVPYTYANDDPVNESDPTGLLGWSEIGQAVAVGLVCVATDGGCIVAGLADLDANVVSNDYEAVTESCKATEEETTSLTDLAGFGLGAGVGELASGSLSEEARKALESTSAGKLALKQLVGLGATSSTLTTLAYAKGHEVSASGCSCQA
jgi:RHS repeat-associated protein